MKADGDSLCYLCYSETVKSIFLECCQHHFPTVAVASGSAGLAWPQHENTSNCHKETELRGFALHSLATWE